MNPATNSKLSVDYIKTGVFAQTFGDDDALRSLVVLKQRGHDAREGESRAVESVAEMGFLILTTVTAFQTVGLISLEVGDGRHLKPATLCG